MIIFRATIVLCLLAAAVTGPRAETAAAIHYAPEENLEKIDVALIDQARTSLDMAAFVLTDRPVMQAIERAAQRGVEVRLYLDGGAMLERAPAAPLRALLDNPGVTVRIKRRRAPPMHLKSYQIDGRLLRTGAANFSASGLKRQDNDLIVIESRAAVARFLHRFDSVFAGAEAYSCPVGCSEGRDAGSQHERQRGNASLPTATTMIPD